MIAIVVLLVLIWIVLGAQRENFLFKTPYPAQCPPQGYAIEAPSPNAPFVRSDEQVQLQPSRCSGNANPPFYAQVYNRNTSPMTPDRRAEIQETTGLTMKGPQDHMIESFQHSTEDYRDVIVDSSIGMYPKNIMDVCSYEYDYPYQ